MKDFDILPPPPPHSIGNAEWANQNTYKNRRSNQCAVKKNNKKNLFLTTFRNSSQISRHLIYSLLLSQDNFTL